MSEWYKTKAQVEQERDDVQKRSRLRELRAKLDATDHKVLADYEPKPGEDVDVIKGQRHDWRSEVRQLIEDGYDEVVMED